MILLNQAVDVTGIFMANIIHIERQRYSLFIYGKRLDTKKRLNQRCKKNNQKKGDEHVDYIKRVYNFVNVINSNKIGII